MQFRRLGKADAEALFVRAEKRALQWFRKAVRMGDAEAHLEIAKYYLLIERKPAKAIPHLEKVRPPRWVSEAGVDEAAKLLKQARIQLKRS